MEEEDREGTTLKMAKKSLVRLLQRIDNKKGAVVDTERCVIARGTFNYQKGPSGNQLSIRGVVIPIGSIRNQVENFYGHGPLLFVDAAYNLGTKVALQEYDKTYRAESNEGLIEMAIRAGEVKSIGLGGGTGTGY